MDLDGSNVEVLIPALSIDAVYDIELNLFDSVAYLTDASQPGSILEFDLISQTTTELIPASSAGIIGPRNIILVVPVPEPSTYAIISTGLIIAFQRKRLLFN